MFKLELNIGIIGEFGSGKTTLAAAIAETFSDEAGVTYDALSNVAEEKINGIAVRSGRVECESEFRRYSFVDFPCQTDLIKSAVLDETRMDGAVLVVDANEYTDDKLSEQIALAKQLSIHDIVVFLNKCDLVDDEEDLLISEMNIRACLSTAELPGYDMPIVFGSALDSHDSIVELVNAIDEYIPDPQSKTEEPFLMAVEEVVDASKGIIAGRIERGSINVNDAVEISGLSGENKIATVAGIEMFRRVLSYAEAGDNIAALLHGIGTDEIKKGDILCEPGSVVLHNSFNGVVYILRAEEGFDRDHAFHENAPLFVFRNIEIEGEIVSVKGTFRHGDSVVMEVKLNHSVVMEEGGRFVLRDGEMTVGYGIVSQLDI